MGGLGWAGTFGIFVGRWGLLWRPIRLGNRRMMRAIAACVRLHRDDGGEGAAEAGQGQNLDALGLGALGGHLAGRR